MDHGQTATRWWWGRELWCMTRSFSSTQDFIFHFQEDAEEGEEMFLKRGLQYVFLSLKLIRSSVPKARPTVWPRCLLFHHLVCLLQQNIKQIVFQILPRYIRYTQETSSGIPHAVSDKIMYTCQFSCNSQ